MPTEASIQQRTLTETNKARNNLRETQLSIERAHARIISLRKMQSNEWVERQINEVIPEAIQQTEIRAEIAKTRLDDLQSGRLRHEITELIVTANQHQQELDDSKKKKFEQKVETRRAQKEIYNKWWAGEKQANRERGRARGNLRRGEQYFWRVVTDFETKNMSKNLEKMPCNRGYRYRGVNFYGELPAENFRDGTRKPTILNESLRGQQLIHEITTDTHKIFRKTQRGRGGQKVLISETARKRPGTTNLMSFVNKTSHRTKT